MGDPSFLNWYRVTNMECFPFLRLIRWSTDYPRHQFGQLGLVSTLGSSLGGTRTSLWVEFPGEAFLKPPWRMPARFKARSLGLCSWPVGCFYFRHHQLPPSPLPKRAWARAESFLGSSGEFHVARQGFLV